MLGVLEITSGYAGKLYLEKANTRDKATDTASTSVENHVILA